MKLTLLLPAKPDSRWAIARQAGVRHAVVKAHPDLTGLGPPWAPGVLRTIRDRFTDAGLTLLGLEGDPFDLTRVKWGLPGADEDLHRYEQLLARMGELGLSLLCYNFMPRPRGAAHDWHRTDLAVPLRGGSRSTGFDLSQVPAPPQPELTADQLWANYTRFIQAVIPAAERAGVRMALHPDDPPLPSLAGVARLFHQPEAFDRAYDLAPSPAKAVTFCQANFRLMGCDLAATARHFARRGRLAFVHYRDVHGNARQFTETWHDDGPTDMPAMLQLYHELGFDGPIRDDHVPALEGEVCDPPGYGALGHLFTVGYMKGVMQATGIPYV